MLKLMTTETKYWFLYMYLVDYCPPGKGGLKDLHHYYLSAEYTRGIRFETAKNTKAFECSFIGFQHSLWKFSTTGKFYSPKSWLWLAAVACVVSWPISNDLLNDIWLTCFTQMCNWNYWHKHRVLWLGWLASSNG